MKRKTKSSSTGQRAAGERVVRVTLRLRYHTNFGQSIFVTGYHEALGNRVIEKAVPLQYLNDEFWQTTISLPVGGERGEAAITYNYFIRESDGVLTHDWGADKKINTAGLAQSDLLIVDSWNFAGFYENAFLTKPFTDVLLRNEPAIAEAKGLATHVFKVKAPLLSPGQTICVIGNNATLHNWFAHDPVLLSKAAGQDYFSARVDLTNAAFPVEYKYGVYDTRVHKLVSLEDGPNRVLRDSVAPGKLTILNDGFAFLPNSSWKGAGVAIPVFSLRSESSFGVGEFTDLKLLVDWCHEAGLKLIQILPINDTIATHTWVDSYPYSAISAFALHPLYLNLSAMARKAGATALKNLELDRQRLNAQDAVDYQAVMMHKLAFIKKIFPLLKNETFASAEYKKFFEGNRHWLVPHAAFSYLRDRHGTADHSQWPGFSHYEAKAVAQLATKNPEAGETMARSYFVQYHLHLQLKEAVDYAHAHGVVLKGDLPIGIYRNGVDAWQNPELYHLDVQAGAPPDPFAAKGQNWGFPTYNWARMEADGFAWWKHRCEQMSRYFDAFRIDHILGFFRIWSIPMQAVEGIMGWFVPAIPVLESEFAGRSIPFDLRRYAEPYITDAVLVEIFQSEAAYVKGEFLTPADAGNYKLKPEFATQRQVEAYFARHEHSGRNEKLQVGLYDLISNVILFEVAGSGGKQFHFRLKMEETPSFKHLDKSVQGPLKELSVNYFFRRQDDFWRAEAMKKLPALKRATRMLVCGEDLGMVPHCVPEVMRQLGLLSLEIQRMPKDSTKEFFHPKDAPYLSVVTPGTHDMSTIRGWWEEEDRARIRAFYQSELNQPGEPPRECAPWINRAIVIQHLESPAMWSIFQLQDLLGFASALRRKNPHEERINVPAVARHFWRYRMHLTLEELIKSRGFTEELREYVQHSGR